MENRVRELLGEGRTASVYLRRDGRALKLFHQGWSSRDVEDIYIRSIEAEKAGIPMVRSYETVEVNGRYGILLDRVDGQSLDVILGQCDEKERFEIVAAFAENVRKIHDTQISTSGLPDQKGCSLQLVGRLSEFGFSEKEIGMIRDLLESMPDETGFIHGDCHTGNVFFRDGEFLFSDLSYFTGKGNRVLDLCCMYSHYVFLPSLMDDDGVMQYIGMSREEGRQIYDAFIRDYYRDAAPVDEQYIAAVTAVRVCLAYAYYPEVFDKGIVEKAKQNLRRRYGGSGREPETEAFVPVRHPEGANR